MPRYMTQFAYTGEAWAALTKNPTDRSEGLRALAERTGAKLIDLYYHLGEYDGTVILEAPDDTTASAVVLAAASAGHIRATKTTKLMTVAEAMEVMRKAGGQSYQPPTSAR